MNSIGLVWSSAIAYGIYISILFSVYFVYSKFLLNCISANFGEMLEFKVLILKVFFYLAAIFAIFSHFFGPLDSSEALALSLSISTIIILFSDYSEVRNLLKLKLLILWIFHVVPLYLILLFNTQLLQYFL
ncbi:MAG: hypothetical protein C00003105_02080 [ANME-2 cluster archaeon HR1]|jgi:hypothetical protein|nr:MAG: hypothetical protein C00003105_02080 [ANME-2 cluster archaeon HR1]